MGRSVEFGNSDDRISSPAPRDETSRRESGEATSNHTRPTPTSRQLARGGGNIRTENPRLVGTDDNCRLRAGCDDRCEGLELADSPRVVTED